MRFGLVLAALLLAGCAEKRVPALLQPSQLVHKNTGQVQAVLGKYVQTKNPEPCGYDAIYRYAQMEVSAHYNQYPDGRTECTSMEVKVPRSLAASYMQTAQRVGVDTQTYAPTQAQQDFVKWESVPIQGERLGVIIWDQKDSWLVSLYTSDWDRWHEQTCHPENYSQYRPWF